MRVALNFVEALTQSCNTWFYQVALKIGADPIIEYAHRLGLGKRTGIPIYAESEGNIPTDDYMMRVHKRAIKRGDVANMAIGQGDILITPLQMAQALSVIASTGKFHQTRLVKQVQSLDNRVVAAYPDRLRENIPVSPADRQGTTPRTAKCGLRRAGDSAFRSGQGRSRRRQDGHRPMGSREQTAHGGMVRRLCPAENPEYAFAALYEGEPNDDSVHGGSHAAPLVSKVFREVYK